MNSRYLPYAAALLLLLFVAALFWLLGGGSGKGRGLAGLFGPQLTSGTNLPLDVRFSYDPELLAPGTYDDRAEFPFMLVGEGMFFCGKRLSGAGKWLAKDPAPLLYDYLGSVHNEMFTQWYALVPDSDPVFEDFHIQGRLGLHQKMSYRTGESRRWADFFPQEAQAVGKLYIEGWAFFSDEDLFYFYAFSAKPLTREQRLACQVTLESLEFGAVLGGEEWVRDPYESVREQLTEEEKLAREAEGQGSAPQEAEGEAGGAGKTP